MRPGIVYGILFFLCLGIKGPSAQADILIGAQAEAGWVTSESQSSTELNRNGTTSALGGGVLYSFADDAVISAILGVRAYDLRGESQRRRQVLQTFGGLLRVDYRLVMGGFEPGLVVAIDQAQGASLKLADKRETQTIFNVGPEVAYRWRHEASQWVSYLAATIDAGVARQNNVMILGGLQYWFQVSSSSTASAPPPPQPAGIESASPPEPEVKQVISPASPGNKVKSLRFKPDVFQFELGSARLTSSSQSKAEAVAAALLPLIGNWSRIDVEGHTDRLGDPKRNLGLSQDRADTIRSFLIAKGIPEDQLMARGFGAEMPLPGLPSESPENRRVELRFHDLKDGEAIAKALDQFIVTEKETP